MQIKVVHSKADIEAFHSLPFMINEGDANWIAPLRQDVEKVFDPQKNHSSHTANASAGYSATIAARLLAV